MDIPELDNGEDGEEEDDSELKANKEEPVVGIAFQTVRLPHGRVPPPVPSPEVEREERDEKEEQDHPQMEPQLHLGIGKEPPAGEKGGVWVIVGSFLRFLKVFRVVEPGY